jgi:hypothetical protein
LNEFSIIAAKRRRRKINLKKRNILEIITNVLIIYGIYLLGFITNSVLGYLKNFKIHSMSGTTTQVGVSGGASVKKRYQWDWNIFLDSLVKYGGIGLCTCMVALGVQSLITLAPNFGIELGNTEAVSPSVIYGILSVAAIAMYGKSITKIGGLVGVQDSDIEKLKSGEKVEVEGVSVEVKQDSGEGKTVEEEEIKELKQMGAFPYYYVDTTSPSSFYNAVNGKGFDEGYGYQCVSGFKEMQYSLSGRVVATSTGGASGYQYQISQIEGLGFTWYYGNVGLQDGDWGIFNGGTYGHVAMYYQGKWFGQNQGASDPNRGNVFNLMALGMSPIGYYRPNKWKIIATGGMAFTSEDKSLLSEQSSRKVAIKEQEAVTPTKSKEVTYVYKQGDSFGQVILNLGLQSGKGLWGSDGDVEFYTNQLHEQGIYGNIPIGTKIKLTRR